MDQETHGKDCPMAGKLIKVFKCKFCSLEIRGLLMIKKHQVEIHNQPYQPVECGRCKKLMTSLDIEASHRLKSGCRPSKCCDLCGKKYSGSNSLRSHLKKVHENLFRFQCDYPECNIKFKASGQALRHVYLHSAELKVWRCTACDTTFRVHSTARKHAIEAHGTTFVKIKRVMTKERKELEGYIREIEPEMDAKPRYQRFKRPKDQKIKRYKFEESSATK